MDDDTAPPLVSGPLLRPGSGGGGEDLAVANEGASVGATVRPPTAHTNGVNGGAKYSAKTRSSMATVDIERPGDTAGSAAAQSTTDGSGWLKWWQTRRSPWRRTVADDRTGKSRELYFNTTPPVGPPKLFPSNAIITTKYTIITFLPKNLFEQFRRIANTYFVLMFVLQTVPAIQAWPVTVAFIPILIVLGISAVKDAFEDIIRFRSDRQLNSEHCRVLRNGDWLDVTWSDVVVGDIVRLEKNETIPADVAVLSSSNEEEGLCYVETKNLDGETNLKVKRGVKSLENFRHHSDLLKLSFELRLDPPIADLYKFGGSLFVHPEGDSVSEHAPNVAHTLTIDNLIPRGCVLRNCKYVLAAVAYTGADTKVMLNAGKTPSKRTTVERLMNEQILFIFGIQVLFAAFFTIGTYVALDKMSNEHTSYYDTDYDSYSTQLLAFLNFWTLMIISQNLIPIALYASMEIVKLVQAYFISQDEEMFNAKLGMGCVPRTWNLSDELGQIEYVFTDKTGTLTSNVMNFNQCSIGGFVYGKDLPTEDVTRTFSVPEPVKRSLSNPIFTNGARHNLDTERQRRHVSQQGQLGDWKAMLASFREYLGEAPFAYSDEDFDFLDTNLMRAIIASAADLRRPILRENPLLEHYAHDDPSFPEEVNLFFTVLALCHSTIAEYPGRDITLDPSSHALASKADEVVRSKIVYNAQSPDEAALVRAAANLGYVFLGKQRNIMSCLILGEVQEYELLNEIAFSSDRKRMTVVVRFPNRQIYVLTKGADNVIYERLGTSAPGTVLASTQQHLERFSTEGLRTLCLAYRKLEEKEYNDWSQRYHAATLTDVSKRQMVMDMLENEIEQDLILLGATAIEDKLQKFVPETIVDLMDAGLLLWMLTGDKLETAVNIALTCNLIDEQDEQIIIASDSNVHGILAEWAGKLCNDVKYDASLRRLVPVEGATTTTKHRIGRRPVLVIEGGALVSALSQENEELFVETALQCRSVVCCRVSPKQKAKVVEAVKKYRTGLTLAIGDGANDVTMIQAAHVGVGIAGLEGRQAVMASDYSVSRFRYLRRLLLVHGRWSYKRSAEMALYFFFKNFVFVFPLFWYQIFNGFSAEMIYQYSYQTFYNLVFTSVPIVFVAVFDQDVPERIDLGADFCLQYPGAYKVGARGQRFTRPIYWLSILDGFYQGTVCFFIPIWTLAFSETSLGSQGFGVSITDLGVVVMTSVMLCVTLGLSLQIRNWTWITHAALWGSVSLFFLYHVIASLKFPPSMVTYELYGTLSTAVGHPDYWLAVTVTVVLALLPQATYRYYKWVYMPDDASLLRELEVLQLEKPVLIPEHSLAKYD